jgi:hypothetical protein
MPRVRQRPSYCLHKPSGRAYTRVNGRMIYLGPWDTEESRGRFAEELEAWSLQQNPASRVLTVDDLALRYLRHCQTYYLRDGRDTGETSKSRRRSATRSGNAAASACGTSGR